MGSFGKTRYSGVLGHVECGEKFLRAVTPFTGRAIVEKLGTGSGTLTTVSRKTAAVRPLTQGGFVV